MAAVSERGECAPEIYPRQFPSAPGCAATSRVQPQLKFFAPSRLGVLAVKVRVSLGARKASYWGRNGLGNGRF